MASTRLLALIVRSNGPMVEAGCDMTRVSGHQMGRKRRGELLCVFVKYFTKSLEGKMFYNILQRILWSTKNTFRFD